MTFKTFSSKVEAAGYLAHEYAIGEWGIFSQDGSNLGYINIKVDTFHFAIPISSPVEALEYIENMDLFVQ